MARGLVGTVLLVGVCLALVEGVKDTGVAKARIEVSELVLLYVYCTCAPTLPVKGTKDTGRRITLIQKKCCLHVLFFISNQSM